MQRPGGSRSTRSASGDGRWPVFLQPRQDEPIDRVPDPTGSADLGQGGPTRRDERPVDRGARRDFPLRSPVLESIQPRINSICSGGNGGRSVGHPFARAFADQGQVERALVGLPRDDGRPAAPASDRVGGGVEPELDLGPLLAVARDAMLGQDRLDVAGVVDRAIAGDAGLPRRSPSRSGRRTRFAWAGISGGGMTPA